VRSRLWTLGLVGAILLLVGPALVGIGYANFAAAESAEINCRVSCNSEAHATLNASLETEVSLGAGLAAGGVGAGCVFAAAVQYMSRWPPKTGTGSVPPQPSTADSPNTDMVR